jgi:2-hydroxychromene-2-carboxylate isomerase
MIRRCFSREHPMATLRFQKSRSTSKRRASVQQAFVARQLARAVHALDRALGAAAADLEAVVQRLFRDGAGAIENDYVISVLRLVEGLLLARGYI